MQYQKESNVICLGNTKQAALFFDKILPLSFMFEELVSQPVFKKHIIERIENVKEYKKFTEAELKSKIEKSISESIKFNEKEKLVSIFSIFESLFGTHKDGYLELFIKILTIDMEMVMTIGMYHYKKDHMREIYGVFFDRINRIFKILDKDSPDYDGAIQFISHLPELISILYTQKVKKGSSDKTIRDDFNQLAKIWGGQRSNILLPDFCLLTDDATENDVTLTLSSIELVDTSKTSWDQILEFRKDKKSRSKLRNLKLFMHENYKGKSRALIEDDLGKRIDDYKNVCKDWGFETVISTISTAVDSKSIQASLAATLASAYFGEPFLVTGAAMPAIMEIGKISVELIRKKHAFNKLKRDHDLAYIIGAKERLENTPKN